MHSVISENQAQLFTRAIATYRKLQRLLTIWERETAKEVLCPTEVEYA